MRITLVTGGARSGKSAWAEREAERLGGRDVTWVATAQPGDHEMAERIRLHREGRPPGWRTVEAPLDAAGAVSRAPHGTVVLDCLTLLASNHLLRGGGEGGVAPVRKVVGALLESAHRREGELVVVTNEVGMGLVPAHPVGRLFRDAQGWANQEVARAAERVVLLVCGIPTVVKGVRGVKG